MTSEELGTRLAAKSQESSAQDREDLRAFGITKARGVLSPLGVALPVILILDPPMPAHILGELSGSVLLRIEAGDEVTHPDAGFEFAAAGFFATTRDADDGLCEGQADGFGFHRDDAQGVVGQSSMGFVVGTKGGASASAVRA
jgi:hypothetical protein